MQTVKAQTCLFMHNSPQETFKSEDYELGVAKCSAASNTKARGACPCMRR